MITLITGGVKSGKSRRALELASGWPPTEAVSFIATATASDDEMCRRIARHREERASLAVPFTLIEEPLALDVAIAGANSRALVDCLPMWVNNLFYYRQENNFESILDAFIAGARKISACVVVTNELGWGNIPFDEAVRRYNQTLAEANRRVAAAADRVELMVCGIPLIVKGEKP